MKKSGKEPVNLNPFFLVLEPISAPGAWSAHLGPDVMTLWDHENKRILTVPRDAVARHIRFAWDMFRGRTISFAIVPGMKAYTFRCHKDTLEKLRAWLPQKSRAEVKREVRLNAIVVALVGVFFLIRAVDFHWMWSVSFLAAGAVGLCYPTRGLYLLNGLLMFLFAIAQIMPRELTTVDIGTTLDTQQLFSIIGVCVFVCWGVQQFSMLGANAHLRDARVRGQKSVVATLPRKSVLVHKIGSCALAASFILWMYIVGLIYVQVPGAHILWTTDWVALPVLGLFTLFAGVHLITRKKPAYADAKVVAQVLIVIVVCIGWGLIGTFRPMEPMSVFDPILTTGGLMLLKPHVWISLLVVVIAFNHWFSRAMDRELEEALEQNSSGEPG